MRHHRIINHALTATAFTLTLTSVLAVEGVSNLDRFAQIPGYFTVQPHSVAVSFRTGPDPMRLDSVELHVDLRSGTGLTFSLASDPDGVFGGDPGAMITSLVGPGSGSSLSLDRYTDPATTVLAANTPYWLIAAAPEESGRFLWIAGLDPAETGLPGWDILNSTSISEDGGNTWRLFQRVPVRFRVNVLAPVPPPIPEASTGVAGGALALAVGGTLCQRRRRSAPPVVGTCR